MSHDHLFTTMEIPIPGKTDYILRQCPGVHVTNDFSTVMQSRQMCDFSLLQVLLNQNWWLQLFSVPWKSQYLERWSSNWDQCTETWISRPVKTLLLISSWLSLVIIHLITHSHQWFGVTDGNTGIQWVYGLGNSLSRFIICAWFNTNNRMGNI